MVRVLLCGDVRGQLRTLCDHVTKLHAKLDPAQHFKAVFCVGEFTSDDMDLDVTPPIPVYFIDSGPAVQDLIEASPQGEELSTNLHFLGHFGVTRVAGLAVAYLSGRQRGKSSVDAAAEASDDEAPPAPAENLLKRYGVSEGQGSIGAGSATAAVAAESWEDIRAAEKKTALERSQLFIDGCYTPLAMERLAEDVADFGGIDLLLCSEWPAHCLTGLPQAWPEEQAQRKLVKRAARQVCSEEVGEAARAAEPKYLACGLGGVFWRRQPWKHERRGEVVASTGEMRCGVCRLVTLGAIDGKGPGLEASSKPQGPTVAPAGAAAVAPKPQKWLHGLDLDPDAMPTTADDATLSPWALKEAALMPKAEDGKPIRAEFNLEDTEERRRWFKKFGINPNEMQKLSDKMAKEDAPKEKKEKRKSIFKVSDKEKQRRKTGGDGHLPFSAKERMSSNRG